MAESLPPDAQRSPSYRAGVGLKAEHYRTILESQPDIGFFEVHAENYMGAGGPPHRFLSAIRESYPLSLHGVGLSIGADRPLDRDHLQRLKELIARYSPALFSEHLAWSSHDCGFLNDLLPVPYTAESLTRIVDHIDQVQEILGRQMLLENPSTYLAFEESTYPEIDFIAAVVRRTGCGLLLDVNNVYVASINQQWDPFAYIDEYPLAAVQEIHLAGHAEETDEKARPLLIDSHDRHVADVVWDLYARAIRRTGPIPTLIEWDANIPDWPTLKAEAGRADAVVQTATQPASVDHVTTRPQSGMTRRRLKEAQTL
ncbi:MNIO family bufferin maturase [Paraburkholderia xenovorans]